VSVHLSSERGALRRVVLKCDAAGCPVQLEPPAAESWRSDPDARTWAREHATGWTSDPVRQTDYCPEHAELGRIPTARVPSQRPTATARDRAGDPLDRDVYAARMRALLADARVAGHPATLTAGQTAVVAGLLDELAGVYPDESLGALAHELSGLLDSQFAGQG
jgi:hypothetical protein